MLLSVVIYGNWVAFKLKSVYGSNGIEVVDWPHYIFSNGRKLIEKTDDDALRKWVKRMLRIFVVSMVGAFWAFMMVVASFIYDQTFLN